MEWYRDTFIISDDRYRVEVEVVVRLLLQQTYWARDIPPEAIHRAIE